MAKKEPPETHLTFPNPESPLARRALADRRRNRVVAKYRVAWSQADEEQARSAPHRHVWKAQKPAWLNEPEARKKFLKEFEPLEEKVRGILDTAPTRRVGSEALASRSREIALLLLEALLAHEWDKNHANEVSILMGPQFRVRGVLKGLTFSGPAVLPEKVRTARAELRKAQKRVDKLPDQLAAALRITSQKQLDKLLASPRFKAWAAAERARFIARHKLATAREELIAFQSGGLTPKNEGGKLALTHRVAREQGAVFGILHQLHHDFGIPDETIAKLLKAADLPAPTAQSIKHIRHAFRRP